MCRYWELMKSESRSLVKVWKKNKIEDFVYTRLQNEHVPTHSYKGEIVSNWKRVDLD